MITFTYFQFAAFLIYMYFAVGIYVILRLEKTNVLGAILLSVFWPLNYVFALIVRLIK